MLFVELVLPPARAPLATPGLIGVRFTAFFLAVFELLLLRSVEGPLPLFVLYSRFFEV